jgi:hypothetical protein
MCILTEIKSLLNAPTMEAASGIVNHVVQLITWYKQNGDISKLDQFLDLLIRIIQEEKNPKT